MTFPKIQSVNFFTDFPIFFDGSFQILMIGKGLKTVFSQKLQVLPSSMVKLNSEFVQMMKNCVFWHKRTQ